MLLVRPAVPTTAAGGHAQRFCWPRCRRAFHAAARCWALDAIGVGVLTLGDIKKGFAAARALSQTPSAAVPILSDGVMAEYLENLDALPLDSPTKF